MVVAQVVVAQVVVDLGAKLLAHDIARQTRVLHELPAQVKLVTGNFTGNNCDENEIIRARVW